MGGSSGDEFPLLSALGLYAADIRGDGEYMCSHLYVHRPTSFSSFSPSLLAAIRTV